MVLTIIIFILILTILIFIHELGHFLAAKKTGIRVDKFAIGFPPKLWTKKIGETEYYLNLIPIGGFVKIFGENSEEEYIKEEEEEKNRSFYYKPKKIQALVLSAGVFMNIFFGFILLSVSFFLGMPVSDDHPDFRQTKDQKIVITSVLKNSPAQKAGIKTGDTILSVENNGKIIQGNEPIKITEFIKKSDGELNLLIKRGGSSPQTIKVSADKNTVPDQKAIGVSLQLMGTLKLPFFKALASGASTTLDFIYKIIKGIGYFIYGIFSGQFGVRDISGPIGIAGIVGQAINLGFVYILYITAMISLNLAVINLAPFPALDGGRLVFVFIEAVMGKNINPKIQNVVNGIGFVLLIILMFSVTVGDIYKFF